MKALYAGRRALQGDERPGFLGDGLDLADLDPALDELLSHGLKVRGRDLNALQRAGSMTGFMPSISVIEHAEPGGVSWITRNLSPMRWSTSTLNPTFSL
jgi:hypothetical protein